MDRILPDDGAGVTGAGLFKRAQCRQRAEVVDRADQSPLLRGAAQKPAHYFEDMIEISAAVQSSDRNTGDGRQFFAQPFDDAIDSQLRRRAGDRQLEENDLLGLSVPGLACPPA